MCLVLFAHESHPLYRLVLAGNRDEFHARPTAPARFWPERPALLAGRDLQGGGTWLGATLDGRIAAVTNFRGGPAGPAEPESRGALVHGFLAGRDAPAAYTRVIHETGARHNGFCFLAGDASDLWFCSNRGVPPRRLSPGLYGLSNGLLDTPWPKVVAGKRELESVLAEHSRVEPERLLNLLADRSVPADERLPETGVGRERERLLGPIFVRSPGYGTRSSTVLLIDREDRVTFVERSFSAAGDVTTTAGFEFKIHRHAGEPPAERDA